MITISGFGVKLKSMLNLENLAKAPLFTKAYIFFKLKKALEEVFAQNYPNLKDNLKNSEVQIQQKKQELTLLICSQNLGFLTWLKTQEADLSRILLSKLEEDKFWQKEKLELNLKFKVSKG